MFSMIHIKLVHDGILVGFTYYSIGDRAEEFSDERWNELNIYFFIVTITLRWN
jgi:hypothetical protein